MAAAMKPEAKYWTYDAMWEELRAWERQYPDLLAVEVAGKSRQGRDLALCILTDRRRGAPESKPGSFVDANIHAGEVTGNAVAMYWMGDILASAQDPDSEGGRLLADHTLYVIPRIAIDGAEAYLTTPMRLRSSPHLYPETEPRSGFVPDDVNGDGLILTIRQESPEGGFKADVQDARLMVPREPDDTAADGPFYHLYPEGRIDRRHMAGLRPVGPDTGPTRRMGQDFNRNFPIRWAGEDGQPGAGPYPLSEPETRTIADSILAHRNVATYVALHTAGGVILRQPSVGDDTTLGLEDLGYYRRAGEMGERRSGYFCRSNWAAFASGFEKTVLMPGAADDWAYETQGILGFTLEIWDLARHAGARGYAEFGRRHLMGLPAAERAIDQRKILAWAEATLGAEAFHPWTPFEHPDLGAVEIGGLEPKFLVQNPPPALLAEECARVASFLSGLALSAPRLVVGGYVVEALSERTFRIAVEAVNAGFLPTSATARGRTLGLVDPVRGRIDGARVVSGMSPAVLGHLSGFGESGEGSGAAQAAVVEWVVEGTPGATVTVTFEGGRAGQAVLALPLRPVAHGRIAGSP
jgi:hypothetical protein